MQKELENRTQFTLRMPNELKNLLTKKAETIGISVNALIINAIWNAIKN